MVKDSIDIIYTYILKKGYSIRHDADDLQIYVREYYLKPHQDVYSITIKVNPWKTSFI